jgi:hypothetical protein
MPCKCNSGEELDISQVIEENPCSESTSSGSGAGQPGILPEQALEDRLPPCWFHPPVPLSQNTNRAFSPAPLSQKDR